MEKFCPTSNKLTIYVPRKLRKKNRILFGKLSEKSLITGRKIFNLSGFGVTLDSKTDSIEATKKRFVSPALFRVENKNPLFKGNLKWELQVLDENLSPLESVTGEGELPEKIIWQRRSGNKKIVRDRSYFYLLRVLKEGAALKFSTRPKPFIIYSVTTLKYRIPVKILSSYEKIQKSRKFQKYLSRLSGKIKKYPDKKWHLVAFVTQEDPYLCDSVFRLRNHLVTKNKIPIERFHTFCEFAEGSEKDTRYVKIVGTKPREEVKLLPFDEKDENTLTIDGEEIELSDNGLFLFPQKKRKVEKSFKLHLSFKTGEDFEASLQRKTCAVRLRKGESKVNGTTILLNEGAEEIFCGEEKRRSFLMVGAGPYMISDSFTPGDFHLAALNVVFNKDLGSFFPGIIKYLGLNSRRFNLDFEFSGAPMSLLGPRDSKQSFYHLSGMIGYRMKFRNFELTPYLGYFGYFSKDNVYRGKGVLGSMTAPLCAFKFRSKGSPLTFDYTMKLTPYLAMQTASFSLQSSLGVIFSITKRQGIYLKYLKNIFRYEKSESRKVTENIDVFLSGYQLEF